MKESAAVQWFSVRHFDLRFLLLRGIVPGMSREVANQLKDRDWIQLPRWVKNALRKAAEKMFKRDKLTLQDWVKMRIEEVRDHARSKKEKEAFV